MVKGNTILICLFKDVIRAFSALCNLQHHKIDKKLAVCKKIKRTISKKGNISLSKFTVKSLIFLRHLHSANDVKP